MRIAILFSVILMLYILQKRIYSSKCFSKVEAALNFNTQGVFQGEKLTLIGIFSNKKLIPLWWLGIKYKVSRNLLFIEDKNENEGNDNYRKDLLFLGSYEKVTKQYNIIASKRGYYKIDELELSTGDLFANVRILRNYNCNTDIYVYPQLIDTDELNLVFNKMNGEILTKRHVIEDPFQLRGIREYSPFDSMKIVNWNATARTGDLKVNQYDYTASGDVIIFLNVERYNSWDPERIVEEGISLAASLCTQYIKYGLTVEIITNGCDSITKQPVKVSAGNNLLHNINVYENLARIDINTLSLPIAEVLDEEINPGQKGKLIILISHYFGDSVIEKFQEVRYRDYNIKWILPKEIDTKVQIEDMKDIYLWEVKDI